VIKIEIIYLSAKFGINVDEAVEVISKEIVKSKLLRKPINRSHKKAACVVCLISGKKQ